MQQKETVFYDLLPSWIRPYHQFSEFFIFPTCILLNGTLIAMLFTEKNADLRAYSRVLFINCVADLVFSAVAFVTQMEYDMPDGRLIFLVNGPMRFAPMWVHYVCLNAYLFTVIITLVIMPLVFIFRYYVIVREHHMTGWEMMKFISFPLFCAFHQCYWFTYAMASNWEHRAEDCAKFANFTVWKPKPMGHCMISQSVFASVQNFITYGSMIFCTVAVMRRLRRKRGDMTAKTLKLQKQMNRVLFVQMMVPVFTSFAPFTVSVTLPLFLGQQVPGMGIIASWLYSLIPLCSPLCTLVLVSNFRRKLFILPRALIKRVAPSKLTIDTSANGTSTAAAGGGGGPSLSIV